MCNSINKKKMILNKFIIYIKYNLVKIIDNKK